MVKIFHLGDITKIDGHNIPLVDIVTGGSPCFAAGTLITTSHGLIPIEDIKVGDLVLTHNNRFMSVIDAKCTGDKLTYNLYGMSCEKIIATENHPFYVRKLSKIWDNDSRSYKREFSSPTWIPLQDLSEEYYLGSPVNNISEDVLDITAEEAYLLGRYVADGYVRYAQRKGRKPGSMYYSVIYCIGKAKLDDFVSNISTYNYSPCCERTVYKVKIHSKRLTQLCLLCGKGASAKFIPSEILNLPISKLQRFFDGYMAGDGCYSKNVYSITTVSKRLAYGLIQIVAKLYNRPCSLYFVNRPKTATIEGRTVNQHDTYQVKFSKVARKQDHAFYENGYIWFPIRRIETNIELPVYNLSVQDDESYCANGVVVHNCQDISIAGKGAGLTGERSGLFFEQMRIVKEMREESERQLSVKRTNYFGRDIKPRYMVWENVANCFSSGHPKGADFQAVLQEICKVVCKNCPPIPIPKEGWHYSGNLDGVGDNGTPFSISWRLHDAQYWGVPQRRRRVCVVADFGGTTASKILFELWGKTEQNDTEQAERYIRNEPESEVQSERNCLSRNTQESDRERKGTSGTVENDIGETISFQERAGKPGGGKGILIQRERTGTISTLNNQSILDSR